MEVDVRVLVAEQAAQVLVQLPAVLHARMTAVVAVLGTVVKIVKTHVATLV